MYYSVLSYVASCHWRSQGGLRGPSPPLPSILETKHKHTFKLHEICQFGQFIFKKIIKIVGTRSHLLKLKCTKFDLGWGSAPDPAGELTALPRPSSCIIGGPTFKGNAGRGRKGKQERGKG